MNTPFAWHGIFTFHSASTTLRYPNTVSSAYQIFDVVILAACIASVKIAQVPRFRPKDISADEEAAQLIDLMKLCWEEMPMFRPSFTTIRSIVQKMNKGRWEVGTFYSSIERAEMYCSINSFAFQITPM